MLTKNQNSIKSSGKFWMSRENFLKSLIKQYDSFQPKNYLPKVGELTVLKKDEEIDTTIIVFINITKLVKPF